MYILSLLSWYTHSFKLSTLPSSSSSSSSSSPLKSSLSSWQLKRYQHTSSSYQLYAKKRDRTSTEQSGKGFLKKSVVDAKDRSIDREDKGKSKGGSVTGWRELTSSNGMITSDDNDKSLDVVDDDDDVSRKTELLLKKYKIGQQSDDSLKNNRSNAKNTKTDSDYEESPFGQKVLASIPMKLQRQIDNTLITATFASLLFVVLCGLGR
jgi:hypothetical protein